MSAYIIVAAKISDTEKFISSYGMAVVALMSQYGGKYLLRAPGAESIEGMLEERASIVMSEWSDKETTRQFWNSGEYVEVKNLREGIADCQVLAIDADKVNGQSYE